MNIIWSKTARANFRNIQSKYFTKEETIRYKIELVRRIENKIFYLGESIPVNEPNWHGIYKFLIDNYKVYYSFSSDKTTCHILHFKHQRQK